MKKVIFTLLFCVITSITFSQTTYYWVGGITEGNISTGANWNTQLNGSGTARATAASTDVLVVDGSNIGGTTPTTGMAIININGATTAQLKIINGANVTFVRTATVGTLTIANNTSGEDGLFIDATSTLTCTTLGSTTGAVYLDFPTSTGLIAGKLTYLQGAATTNSNRLTARTVGAVVFASGSTFEYDNTLIYPFGTVGTGTSNSSNGAIVFQSGANLINNSIYSPFGSSSTSMIVDFKPGSNYYVRKTMTTGSVTNSKTFANVFIQNNSTITTDAAALNKIENLTIEAGSTWVVGTSSGTQIPLLGNLVVNGTLNGTNGSGGNTTLIMAGSTAQTISGSGTINVSNFIIGDNSNVTLNTDINVSTATNVYGAINFTTRKINGAGSFTSRVNFTPSTGATQTGAGLTNGSFLVSVATGLGLSALPGLSISGTGIPTGTNIASYSSSNGQIVLSKPATATNTGVTLTFSSNTASLTTSNVNGFDSTNGCVTVTGTKTYQSGTSYVINAATVNPIGISSGSTVSTVGNLTLNAPVTTNFNTRVNGTLTLNTGKLTIRAVDTIRLTTPTTIAGAPFSSTKYIAIEKSGANIGALRIDGFTTPTLFPIGSSTNYLPVTLTPTTTDTTIVNVFEGATIDGTPNGTAMNAGQKTRIVDAIWNVNRLSTNTDACAISTGFVSGLEGSIFTTLANNQIGISRYDGTNWTAATGSGDNVANTATASGFTSFGAFGVGQVGLTLPVQITTFTAKENEGKIVLNWNVEKEIAIASYEIEKSTDGIRFTSVGVVQAINQKSYLLTDFTPLTNNYYRIKIIGKDNSVIYSNIINVKLNAVKGDISIYPNPVKNGLLNIQLSNLNKGLTDIKIYNPLGQVIYTTSFMYDGGTTLKTVQLNTSIISGIYNIQVNNATVMFNTKLVIQ